VSPLCFNPFPCITFFDVFIPVLCCFCIFFLLFFFSSSSMAPVFMPRSDYITMIVSCHQLKVTKPQVFSSFFLYFTYFVFKFVFCFFFPFSLTSVVSMPARSDSITMTVTVHCSSLATIIRSAGPSREPIRETTYNFPSDRHSSFHSHPASERISNRSMIPRFLPTF